MAQQHRFSQLPAGSRKRVLVACILGSFAGLPALLLYPFGIFAVAIADDTGWAEQELGTLIGPAIMLSVLTLPLTGWIVARFDKTRLAVIASASLGAGIILLGLAPSFFTGFAIALFSAILLGSLATTALYATMISQIFDQRRGLMLGLVMSCTGLGVAAIPPFATWLLNTTDWRTTYMVLGGMAFAIAVTNHVLLRHIADDNMPSKSSSTKGEMRHAMRRPVFWLLATFMFLIGIAANTVPIYIPLILSDKGFTPASSAFALSVVGITMIASRVALGFLMDKTSIRLTLAIMVTGPILGSSILLFTQNPALIPVAAAGFGIATGGEYLALSYMIARYFPLHAFGGIYGWLSFALGIGQVVGPTATAAVRRATGSYDPALAAIFFVALITLGVCMLFTSRLSRPAAQH